MNRILIDAARHYRLVADSITLSNLQNEQLPELRLTLVLLAFVIVCVIGLGFMLAHECREVKRLESVIDQMHAEIDKKVDENVLYEAHREVE